MSYTIKKETNRALLLTNSENKSFWIQKRWMREDGSLTAKGIEAEKDAKTLEEFIAEKKAPMRVEVVRETEKAIMFMTTFYDRRQEDYNETGVWLPKSLCKFDEEQKSWFCPADFMIEKEKEASAKATSNTFRSFKY